MWRVDFYIMEARFDGSLVNLICAPKESLLFNRAAI